MNSTEAQLEQSAAELRATVEQQLDLDSEFRQVIARTPDVTTKPEQRRSSSIWLSAACVALLAVGLVGLVATRSADTSPTDVAAQPVDPSAPGRLSVVVDVEAPSPTAAEAAFRHAFADIDATVDIEVRDGALSVVVDGITRADLQNVTVASSSSGFEIRPVLNETDDGERATAADGSSVVVGPWETTAGVFTDVTVVQTTGFDLMLDLGETEAWDSLVTECFGRTAVCPTGQIALLDGTDLVIAPTVNSPVFDGVVSITGNFTESEAGAIAANALPYEIRAVDAQWNAPGGVVESVEITLD